MKKEIVDCITSLQMCRMPQHLSLSLLSAIEKLVFSPLLFMCTTPTHLPVLAHKVTAFRK